MSKNRLTKKEMQVDELRDALLGAGDYVAGHKTEAVRWGAIGAGAVILVLALWGFMTWRTGRLSARLSAALALYDAPLVTDSGVAPGQKVFKDAAERTAELKKQLKALADDAPSSSAGRIANMLLLSLDGPKNAPGSRLDAVKALASSNAGMPSAAAAVSLLEAQAAAGRTKEAIDAGRKLLDGSSRVPKDILLFTLGGIYEKSGQVADAKTLYQRLVSDFPDSPMRGEAQQRLTGM